MPPVSVNANGLSVVHRGSNGVASATMPDVCKTPSSVGSPVPVPYPNIAMSSDLVMGTVTVTVDGQMAAIQGSKFIKSTGDEPGVAGGVLSQTFIMEATFISFSPTVSMDGMPVCRLTDKMLMNHGNTACLGGEMQMPVPMAPSIIPPPEEPKFCIFEKLTLECGHESRKFKVDASVHNGTTLQVIANKGPEKVRIGFKGSCGLTSESPGCVKPHVIDERGHEVEVDADYTVELRIPEDSERVVDNWWSALSNVMDFSQMIRDSYTVYGTSCNGTGSDAVPGTEYAQIEVFPNASLDGEIEFAFKFDKKSKATDGPDKDKKSFSELDEQGVIELKGKLTVAVGKSEFPIEGGLEAEGPKRDSDPLTRRMFQTTQGVLTKLASFLNSIQRFYSAKLDIRWPSIKMGGGIKLAELEGSSQVAQEGEFFIEANPLIGLQIKIDILDWIIFVAATAAGQPALGKMLIEIKERAASGKNPFTGGEQPKQASAMVDIGIALTVGGDVAGGLGWKVSKGKVEGDRGRGRIEAGVDFKLEGYAKGEIKVFVVKAAGGASVSVLGADGGGPSRISGKCGPKEGKGFGWWGSISYNGLAIYFAYYAELGSEYKTAEADPNPNPYGVKVALAPKFSSKENKLLYKFVDPCEWPKPGETSILRAL